MHEPHLRAADADRAAVATVLGEHMAAGRLTVDEYDERLSRAYAAKTYGELAELTADLPPTPRPAPRPTAERPVTGPAAPVPQHHGPMAGHPGHTGQAERWGGGDVANSWRSWLTTSLIVLVIWAATSLAAWEFHYFWPVWVIGPWGAVLLAQTLTRGSGDDDQRDRELPA